MYRTKLQARQATDQHHGATVILRIIRFALPLLALICTIAGGPPIRVGAEDIYPQSHLGASCVGEPTHGCTVFTVSKGDQVFFGGNNDYVITDTSYWVDPRSDEHYGAIWIGEPGDPQQGVNEAGLAYDANGLPEVRVNSHPERMPTAGGRSNLPIQILRECATVQDVIQWVQNHQWSTNMNAQLQFADASGDAVLISPGSDGELVFTRKPLGDGHLLSTNFNVINPDHRNGDFPCWRYEKAQDMLGRLVGTDTQLTAQLASDVLDAVHLESASSWTLGSLVADLPNGIVYLYYFYQFDRPVVLRVAEEVANPRGPLLMSELFPSDVQQEAARRHTLIVTGVDRCLWLGLGWVTVVVICLGLLVALSLLRRGEHSMSRNLLFWVPVVTLLGPLGFLIWLLVGHARKVAAWRRALTEAVASVASAVVAFGAYLAVHLLAPGELVADAMQLGLILLLPPALSWLVLQGLLLSLASRQSILTTLMRCLPASLVTANLGMASMQLIAVPMIRTSIRSCEMFPSPGWSLGVLWAVIVLGGLVSAVLQFAYESWATRHGFAAWSAVLYGEDQMRSPSWRTLWWWILISYIVLIGGVVASVML